jgi:hypothetical protein
MARSSALAPNVGRLSRSQVAAKRGNFKSKSTRPFSNVAAQYAGWDVKGRNSCWNGEVEKGKNGMGRSEGRDGGAVMCRMVELVQIVQARRRGRCT